MFEDDTSGCHSQAVSCMLITSTVTAAFVHVPTVCHCEEKPMKSLQKCDSDRKQQWHAGQSYVACSAGFNHDDSNFFILLAFGYGLGIVGWLSCTKRKAI